MHMGSKKHLLFGSNVTERYVWRVLSNGSQWQEADDLETIFLVTENLQGISQRATAFSS